MTTTLEQSPASEIKQRLSALSADLDEQVESILESIADGIDASPEDIGILRLAGFSDRDAIHREVSRIQSVRQWQRRAGSKADRDASEQALTLDHVPERVVVLGGGVIGVEFASVWASFGAQVTIVEALPRLVPNEDEFASKQLERAFRRRKIGFKTGVKFTGASQSDEGVSVSLETGETLEADLLLVAVGRGPNTAGHGFEETGVAMERGFVTTDERLRTNLPGVYAVGDIVAGLQLAHRGFAQGIFVAEDIAGHNPTPIDEAGIPRVTYCHPEVASVGLTEEEARQRHGPDVTTLVYDLGGNGKSQILKTSGAVKVVKAPDGPVVGLHMVGDRVGELIGEAQLIYNWEAFPEDVAPLIHAHPTQTEALGEAHLALAGKPLHTHG
jgi:dihydrolipoamide dehydrogenase